jgi:tRNA threonylcarbamoyladenosine biosynthesis protein TsaB
MGEGAIMIVLIDTSTPVCKLTLVDGEQRMYDEWQADRGLAKGLLQYLHDQMASHSYSWKDIIGIGVMEGPGSFTGLRIGLTVMNTIADSEHIPIVGARGESWQEEALGRLENGQNDTLVMPFYGSEAHITSPKK